MEKDVLRALFALRCEPLKALKLCERCEYQLDGDSFVE
jgi:hypothetical protein